jgi:hypothetical protein
MTVETSSHKQTDELVAHQVTETTSIRKYRSTEKQHSAPQFNCLTCIKFKTSGKAYSTYFPNLDEHIAAKIITIETAMHRVGDYSS